MHYCLDECYFTITDIVFLLIFINIVFLFLAFININKLFLGYIFSFYFDFS